MFKQVTGDSHILTQTAGTSVPHAHGKDEREDDARAVCWRWCADAVKEVNHLVELGYTVQAAIRIMKDSAVREVVPVDPEKQAFNSKAQNASYGRWNKQVGDGVDGVTYLPQTRQQACIQQTPVVADGSLGVTSKGVAIRPRRHLYCKHGHAVNGDNVCVKAGTGQQVCKKCNYKTRREYAASHGGGRFDRT